MKTTSLLLLALPIILGPTSVSFAQTEGHGGRIIKCLIDDGVGSEHHYCDPERDDSYTYQLRDHEQNDVRWHFPVDFTKGNNSEQKLYASLDRLYPVDPVRAELYRRSRATFDNRTQLLKHKYILSIKALEKIFELGQYENCKTVVLINQKPAMKLYTEDLTSAGLRPDFWMVQDLRDFLEMNHPDVLAETYQHELVYEEGIPKNISLDGVEYFNSYISSSMIEKEKFGSYKYFQVSIESGIGTAELNTPEKISLPINQDFGTGEVIWTANQVAPIAAPAREYPTHQEAGFHYEARPEFDNNGNLKSLTGVDGTLHYQGQNIRTYGPVTFHPNGSLARIKASDPIEVDYFGSRIKIRGWILFSNENKLLRGELAVATPTLPVGSQILFVDPKSKVFEHTIIISNPTVSNDEMIVIVEDGGKIGFRRCKISDPDNCTVIGKQDYYRRQAVLNHVRVQGAGFEFEQDLKRRQARNRYIAAGALITSSLFLPVGGALIAGSVLSAQIAAFSISAMFGTVGVIGGIGAYHDARTLEGGRTYKLLLDSGATRIDASRYGIKRMVDAEHQQISDRSLSTDEMSNAIEQNLAQIKRP